ncbi:MAG: hypothetical protein HOV80_15915 [Polyangiaceae bacterium]|nr:hypothetical protein [Polyangiaceae bacterium]
MSGPSQHCTSCGLPMEGTSCSACGGGANPLSLTDGDPASGSAHAPDPTRPELELGFEAWQAGDAGRLVSQCLGASGATDLTMQVTHEGPIYKGVLRGIAVLARARRSDGQIVFESPVVRLPQTQYVPALRMLLELSDRDAVPVRYSVRGDWVLARFVGTLAELSPSYACAAIDAVVTAASDGARLLVGVLQARAIGAQGHLDMTIDSLPRGTALQDQGGGVAQAARGKKAILDSIPPLVDGSDDSAFKQTPAVEMPAARFVGAEGIPAVLLPPGGLHMPAPQRSKVPTPARIEQRPRMRSPAPGLGLGTPLRPPAGPAALTPVQGIPAATAAAARPNLVPPAPSTKPIPLQRPVPPPPPAGARAERTLVSEATPATTPSAVAPADPLADTFIGDAKQPPPKVTGPGAGLCELLHKAQTLGAVLSFADQPATMCLLIRATVYRAVLEHDKFVPNAVATLFQGTFEATKEIYITAPGVRRGAMAIPAASPAFELMSRIAAQRGECDPVPTVPITPITTAQDAKQHLARYVSEIDQAPADLELRHFLALGALSELLVRTKLPGPTQERLRGIVAHAQKEGARQPAVELMMTALTRMMA